MIIIAMYIKADHAKILFHLKDSIAEGATALVGEWYGLSMGSNA